MELAQWAVPVIFENWPFAISPHFLLIDTSKPLFFQMFSLRSVKAYLCPNMINFDGVKFREHRSEEVMFLLMLSVCLCVQKLCLCHSMHNECDEILTINLKKESNMSTLYQSLWIMNFETGIIHSGHKFVISCVFSLWAFRYHLFSLIFLIVLLFLSFVIPLPMC